MKWIRLQPTGLCRDCEEYDKVLPSIETFLQRWNQPKAFFLFYEYFFKPVIGETIWNRRIDENKRLGSKVSEAFALAELVNNYHAFLYEFKTMYPNTTLKTEYDDEVLVVPQGQHQQGQQRNEQQEQDEELQLFCGDLDLFEVSVPQTAGGTSSNANSNGSDEEQAARDQDFTLLLMDMEGTAVAPAYQEARAHSKAIQRGIRDQLRQDRAEQGSTTTDGANNDVVTLSSIALYAEVKAKLVEEATQVATTTVVQTRKRKAKAKRGMKRLTSPQSNKTKKGGDPYKSGWMKEGRKFVNDTLQKIQQDEVSGIRVKWEEAYKKLLQSVKQIEGEEDEEEQDNEPPVNVEMMYSEV
jgi:hypothetical protein